MLTYPSTRPDGVPFVLFKFLKSRGNGSEESRSPVALFMPPAFQITDGQDYEFAQKSGIAQFLSGLTDIANGGSFPAALTALMEKISPAMAQQAAAKVGRAVRDPKFFNYKEPRPREFTFNYKFEPKNKADAQAMMKIIDNFRVASYPVFLNEKNYGLPDTVLISFEGVQTGIESNIQEVVIKDINTTLSEGEQMMTFTDGIPTQISLQITFAETKLLSKDVGYWEYDGDNATGLGGFQ